MEIIGEYRIAASQEDVWNALNDPAVLKASIAGCKQLDKVSDTEFSAIVATKVGPVSATFRGTVTLSELDPPRSYTLTGRGQGGAAGFARMTAKVSLSPDGAHTLLKYAAEAEIGGKLASVGGRLVQGIAKKNADDFFAAFARQLGGEGAPQALAQQAPRPDAAGAVAPATYAPALADGGLRAAVPAWLVVFCTALGIALGFCAGRLTF